MTTAEAAGRLCRVEHIMGTAIVIDVRAAPDPATHFSAEVRTAVEAAVDSAFAHFRAVDARFSTYKPDSEVSRLNRGDLGENNISAQLREVLDMCETARQISDGFFDIRGHRRDGTIDPSGLVKGWSVEGAARILDAAGIDNYTINAAGDVVIKGRAAPAEPWRIGLRNPWDATTTVAVISAADLAIATSGTRPIAHARIAHTGLPAPSVVVTAEESAAGKPDPAPYLLAAQRLGADPRRCLVVEDTPAGLAAGRAAGCATLAVTTSHAPQQLDADGVVADLSAVRFAASDDGVRLRPA